MSNTPESLHQQFDASPVIPDSQKNRLRSTIVIPLVGVAGVGKTSITDVIVDYDQEFHQVPIETTQPKRDGDGAFEYVHHPHDETGFEYFTQKIEREGIVQGTAHPNGKLCATFPSGYAGPYAIFTPLRSELPKLQRAGFAGVRPMHIVAPQADYHPRLQRCFKRIGSHVPTFMKLLDEGIGSIVQALDTGDTIWINNPNSQLSRNRPLVAALEIMNIVKHRQQPNENNRAIGEKMLSYLQDVRSELPQQNKFEYKG